MITIGLSFKKIKTKGKLGPMLILVIIIVFLGLSSLIQFRYVDTLRTYLNYTPKEKVVTEAKLKRDLKIMRAKEGIHTVTHLFSNSQHMKNSKGGFLDENGSTSDGTIIYSFVTPRLFTDSKEPVEIRYYIRIMLYLQERKMDEVIGEIVGITGSFKRGAHEIVEGDQDIKMSVIDFIELYEIANVSSLGENEQVEILTQLWIEKTDYWRRGLFGIEVR